MMTEQPATRAVLEQPNHTRRKGTRVPIAFAAIVIHLIYRFNVDDVSDLPPGLKAAYPQCIIPAELPPLLRHEYYHKMQAYAERPLWDFSDQQRYYFIKAHAHMLILLVRSSLPQIR